MTHTHITDIPVYNVKLLICVADNPASERRSHSSWLGMYNGGPFNGLASFRHGRAALFFDRKHICHGDIAHEVFHITHHIMGYLGDKFTLSNQEPYAYLAGWITQNVYKLCTEKRIKVWNKL